MIITHLFFLLSALSRFESVPNALCKTKESEIGDFTNLVLATFYLPTHCLRDNPKPAVGPVRGAPEFTIHGLWPGRTADDWPQCCSPESIHRASQLRNVTDLVKYWVSTKGSDDKLWAHEWEKHGTCGMNLFRTENAYFNATVELLKRIQLDRILYKYGIQPSSKEYSNQLVSSIFNRALHYKPILECSTINQTSYLSGLYVCLDVLWPYDVVACPSDYYISKQNNCPDKFRIPPYPSSCFRS
ncbi:putative Extracellular ribonuclease LE [Blattamonas nauphoetae]|uniref:Extracellular ribonuclease LE n=1 Tax=Blattamonas nauphoetae TaxID=2049346 RepID=A0ABQ9WS78_9EUKA|nr:putative Extracellular ribonuclease LE [Blattamonas nauphoetae]